MPNSTLEACTPTRPLPGAFTVVSCLLLPADSTPPSTAPGVPRRQAVLGKPSNFPGARSTAQAPPKPIVEHRCARPQREAALVLAVPVVAHARPAPPLPQSPRQSLARRQYSPPGLAALCVLRILKPWAALSCAAAYRAACPQFLASTSRSVGRVQPPPPRLSSPASQP